MSAEVLVGGSPRVAITVEQFWERVPGGTAVSIARFLSAHRQLPPGARSRLVGVAAAHPPGRLAPELRTGLRVRHLPLPRPVLYDAWRSLRTPPVQTVTGRVDLLHATTFAIPPVTAPLVVTVHDLAFLSAPEHFTPRGNRFFRAGLELTRRRARLVLVPSRQTMAECVEAGIESERLRLVPWGVDPVRASPSQVELVRRRHGLGRDYVLWCGTHEPRKNLPRLLSAFARVAGERPDLDLVLVGPPGWGDSVGAGERPPVDRVHTLGRVPADELAALYAGATVFCYPSLREGFGLPVLEAMSAGAPVVTSAGTPMADLLGGGGLAVSPTDEAALAEAMLAVLADRDRYASVARVRAGEFTWRATAEATQHAYDEAL